MWWMLLYGYVSLSLIATVFFLAACVVSGRIARREVGEREAPASDVAPVIPQSIIILGHPA